MYICLCNALTDHRLKQAAAMTGSCRPGDIYAACGCRARCGQCVRTVLQLLRAEANDTADQLQAAD